MGEVTEPGSAARDAYWQGTRDGGLAVLAEAFGVKPDHVNDTHVMGRPIKVSVEWQDGEPGPEHMGVLREMVRNAQERMRRDGT